MLPAALGALGALLLSAALASPPSPPRAPACAPDDAGLTLPAGFCASLVGQGLGAVRHLVAAPNGDLFVAVEGGSGGVLALRDADGDGAAEVQKRFGPGGGTGIALANGFLYFATADRVIRWPWAEGQLEPAGDFEVIVHNLPVGGHRAKPIVVASGDRLFVDMGSLTNSCQKQDRAAKSPGNDPCTELEQRAGVWLFSASKPNQGPADGQRWATGLRNPEALAIEPRTGVLWGATHGRDQLGQNWGFTDEESAENPAEEFGPIERGADYGWPYCYFDPRAKRKVLAPEYGGDGKKTDRCTERTMPAVGFPAHWAPLALAFYQGSTFGPEYAGGAFLAFHGSWNRAPMPQAGYRLVFVPMRDGKVAGDWRTFASPRGDPTGLRASGVAVGPDGSLYLAADAQGKIWRIVRRS